MRKIYEIMTGTFLIVIFFLSGCATTKYSSYSAIKNKTKKAFWQNESQIEVGNPNLLIDGLGNIVSLPKKIILLDYKIDSHAVSSRTIKAIEEYIRYNPEMVSTKIRVNQFTPLGEFKRLIKNKKISWWWRIFPGVPVTMLSLTGRLLGGDHYNPYTDTINIYSDIIPVALHEAGHAVDTAEKVQEGWADYYIVGRILTPVTLHQEYVASEKTVDYLAEIQNRKEENNAYRILFPAYGTYVGSYSGIPYGDAVGAAVGHIVSIVPRYNNKLAYKALDSAVWDKEIVTNIKSEPIAKSLIEDHETEVEVLNKTIFKESETLVAIDKMFEN